MIRACDAQGGRKEAGTLKDKLGKRLSRPTGANNPKLEIDKFSLF